MKPGDQSPAKPSPDLPPLDPSAKFSTKTLTDRGSMPQDQIANNAEDLRFRVPTELKGKLAEYNNSLATKLSGSKRPTAAKPKSGK